MKARRYLVLLCLAFFASVFAVGVWALAQRAGDAAASPATGGMDAMNIDMDPTGNTATSLGTVQVCGQINENDTLDADEDSVDALNFDVTAVNIPASNPMFAWVYTLDFPDTAVVVASEDQNFMLNASAGSALFAGLSDPLPDAASPWNATAVDGGPLPGSAETGSGVLNRVTIQTFPGSVSGVYPLTLTGNAHVDTNGVGRFPDVTNNARVAVNTPCPVETDVKVMSAVSTVPAGAQVLAPFDVTVDATVHNNGAFSSVNTDVQVALNLPGDCTAAGGDQVTLQDLALAVSSPAAIPAQTFSVTCSMPSFHDISATVTASIDDWDAIESTPANNSVTSMAGTVPVTANADFKSSGVSVAAPAAVAQGQSFDITVNATLHNNGPNLAPAVPTITIAAPADCAVTGSPTTLAPISLPVSAATPLPTQAFSVSCSDVALDTITATVDLGTPTHVTDAASGNNSSSGQAVVDIQPDDDLDGVENAADQCPATAPGATVDANGCSQAQVDADLDTVCDPGKTSTLCTGMDQCPATAPGATVDANGCSQAQVDADLDTVCDPGKTSTLCTGMDQCPATAPGATVDANGCSQAQVDADLDTVCDPGKTSTLCTGMDQCPATAPGATVDANGCSQAQVDADLDTVCDPGKTSTLCTGMDNCPSNFNSDQSDVDGDGPGDACDPDADNDTLPNPIDNCDLVVNPVQEDFNADGEGDHCDDTDFDGLLDIVDLCKLVPDPDQRDADGDGDANPCDPDDDNDTVVDRLDNCQFVENPEQRDIDADGVGDACDDTDGDGIYDGPPNGPDNCILVPNPGQENADGDALGDACDSDDDNDGVPDITDNCYLPNPGQEDVNGNGTGDACEDADGDGDANGIDNCPAAFNPDQQDVDGDRLGDVCDPSNAGQTTVSDPGTGAVTVASAFSDIVFSGTTAVPGSTVTIVKDTTGTGTITTDAAGTGLVAQRYDLRSTSSLAGTITQVVDFPPPGITRAQLANLTVTKQQAGGPLVLAHNVISTVPPSGEPVTQATIDYFLPDDAEMVVKVPADSDMDGVVDQYDLNHDGDFLDALERDNCPVTPNANQMNTDAAVAPPGDGLGDACDSDDDDDGYFDSVEAHVGTNPLLTCGGTSTWPADLVTGGIPDSTNLVNILDITSFITPTRYLGTNLGANPGDVRWDLSPGKGPFLTDINIADLTSLVVVKPPWMGGMRAFNGHPCPFAQ